MIRTLFAGLALAACAGAAEDLIRMRDGSRLLGDVESEDARHVVMRIDNGLRVTLDRVQVDAVVRGGGRGLSMVEDPLGGRRTIAPGSVWDPAKHHWTLGLAVTAGWTTGYADSDGRVVDTTSGTGFDLSGSFDLGGAQLPAGAALRLTHDAQPVDAGWRLGVQAGWNQASSDEAGCSTLQLAGLAGWSWGDARRRHAVQALAGWCSGSLGRDLVLTDTNGVVLGSVENSADLSGFTVAVEAETSWLVGRWVIGALAGISYTALSGDTAWTAAGIYQGTESIDATPLAVYAGAVIGLRL